jgi:3-oxoadipate enol-lactonase
MPTADLGDVALQYELAGDGPPLLVLSGTGSDLRRKPSILESPLVERFTLLTYDHRGLGRSRATDPTSQPSMLDFARDALRLCDYVGWTKFLLLGISFGGMVAQEVALAGEDRILRLVLACTSAGGAGGASAPLHELYRLPLAERIERLTDVNDLRTTKHPQRRAEVTRFLSLASEYEDPVVAPGLHKQLEARRHHDAWERLPLLRVPTLVAAGRYDGIAPLANAEALASRISAAQLRVFEGGHVFLLQDRTAWSAIVAFLQEG